jgi:trimethylamine--corrinoid protein Co-methyltransferase
VEDGGADAAARAHRVWQEWLRDFEPPPIDAAIREELDEFVARRTAEGGAPPEQ